MDICHFMTSTWSVEVEKIGELMPTANLSMQHYIGKPDRCFLNEMLSKLEPARWEGSPKCYGPPENELNKSVLRFTHQKDK